MSEKELQAAIVECAERLMWFVYHTHDSRNSAKGFPDLVLAHHRHGLIFAELKVKGRLATPEQNAWIHAIAEATAGSTVMVCIWREEDWTGGRVEAMLRGF